MRQWTKEQEKAINTQNSNLLISAAAGSGKTAVLVERIIKIITNVLKPVDIDRLLVVTFTEAAAAEMRHRIQEAIFEKLEKDAENGHLRRQIALLNRAPISTIHSFCNSVIRENFYKIGIDPSYKIADSKESFILQEEAMEEIFTAEYLKENNEIFYDLIETYGDRFLDERLRELIISIYNFSQNSTDPENWLLESVKKFELEDDFLIEKTDWGKIIKNSILTKLQGALNSCENALILCELDGGPHKYIENIKADKELINGLILACQNSFNEISLAFQNIEKFSALSRKKDTEGMDESLKESVKYIRDKDIKGVVNKIKEDFFFKDTKDLKSDMLKLKPIITKLCELVTNFKEAYFKKKIENNLLDFGDLEHLCLKILKDHDISDIYKEKFYEVFTDEYQDSNMIQETILSLVSKENNRFMVGDIKQSIYKFRRAKPEIFIEKYEKYQDDGRNIKVNLSKNFRSRENIINTVNFFFEQIMSREVGGINYSNDEALYYGANYEEINENLDTEVYVIDSKIEEELEEGGGVEELKNIELEAKLIAKKITEMGRDYKDIAILVRQRKHINTITEELTKYNIPIYSEESVEFFKNTEIMTILSILKTIDNPLQDVNFLGSLY
ncbi:MAG: UvrD-helicase domain-containing protein, partial [Defluviitaleaceae bacterium]|nr:UvrD-helicase domain-containing protein [Defluviitaleaceae bacterium]